MSEFYISLFDSVTTYLRGMDVDLSTFKENADFEREFWRLVNYKKYYRAYNNSIDSKWSPQDSQNMERIRVNVCKAIVDRSVDFLISKPFTPYPPEKYAKLMTPVVEHVSKESGIEQLSMEVVTNGSICGDSFVKVVWDSEEDNVRFQLLDPEKTFLKYSKNSRNRTVLSEAVIVWEGEHDVYGNGSLIPVLFKELWIDKKRIVKAEYKVPKNRTEAWTDKILAQLAVSTDTGKYHVNEILIEEEDNDLGFIPVVHFRNQIAPLEVYGKSDLANIIDINSSLNDAATQYLDSVKYHGSPVTLVYGIKIGNIRRGANKIWSGLPKDGKVEQLGGQQNFSAVKEFMDLMMDYTFFASGVPEISTGLFQNISNATGVALQVQYLPLIGLTRRKRLSYGPSFQQIYEYALKMLDRNKGLKLQEKVDKFVSFANDLKHVEFEKRVKVASETPEEEDDYEVLMDLLVKDVENSLEESPFWKIDIKWGEYLPKDSKQELDEIREEMDLGLESRKGALRRRGVKDIEAKLREIDEDAMAKVAKMAAYTPENTEDFFGADDYTPDTLDEGDEEIEEEVTETASELQKDSQNI